MSTSTPGDRPTTDAEVRFRHAMVHAVLRGVVHDLNNPLATVAMAAAALRSVDDDEQRHELLDIVEREVMRASRLAADASGRYAPSEASVQPTELTAVVERIRAWCRAQDLEVEVTAAMGDARVHADPELLPRAIFALIEDAHGTPGRGRPVVVEVHRRTDEVVITITDDGDPVPDRISQRPFLPFLGELPLGRGVGVDVAAARVHLSGHGAGLTLTPGLDAGNVVTVRLRAAADGATDAAAVQGDPATDAVSRSWRAVVVDDDASARQLLISVLGRAGWTVTAVADGAAAEAALEAGAADVVLLDLHVGDELGTDIAARLARRWPEAAGQVVYLTGDAAPGGQLDGRPVLGKPFELAALYALVEDVATGGRGATTTGQRAL
ncbi:response regulator [Egicoccus sp. AB-alg6-2]|uniref:ATP-binding response regulator n=1 Tax=Egicoccus sp. AB-alg6-2 TaxID=3242692 RepID=UPI00359E563B